MANWTWEQGDHVTQIGPTKVGKSTLSRAILAKRSYVVTLACKGRDPVIDKLKEDGHRVVRSWKDVDDRRPENKVILWPKGDDPDDTESKQWREFRECLNDVFQSGGWTVNLDDISYVSEYLGLERELKRLYYLGRTDRISMLSSAQVPVNIVSPAWDQVIHLYVFHINDGRRVRRIAEIAGADPETIAPEIASLSFEDHDVLYIDGSTGEMRRTRVES